MQYGQSLFWFYIFICSTDLSGVFTSVGALFSGLAFALLIVTAMMQRSELKLQRKELALQRTEMSLSRQEFQTQNKTLSRQRFENTFFQLLQMQREIANLISIDDEIVKIISINDDNGKKQIGLNAFVYVFEQVKGILYERQRNMSKAAGIYSRENDTHIVKHFTYNWQDVAEEFRKSYESHENEFGQYFKHLIVLLDFVGKTEADIRRERYIGFINAQLSLYEQLWLFYMGLTDYGFNEKLKSLIENSRLLVGINTKALINEEHYLQYHFVSQFTNAKEAGDLGPWKQRWYMLKRPSIEIILKKCPEQFDNENYALIRMEIPLIEIISRNA